MGKGLPQSSQLCYHLGPPFKPYSLSFSCKQTPKWRGGAYITHICLLQILLSFMLLGQIPGKGPLGEAPFLCTPCPTLSVRRQNNFFHKVCLSQRKHTHALWHETSEGKDCVLNYTPRGVDLRSDALRPGKQRDRNISKMDFIIGYGWKINFLYMVTMAWIKCTSQTPTLLSPWYKLEELRSYLSISAKETRHLKVGANHLKG